MPSKDLPRFALDAVAVVTSHRAFSILLTPRFGSALISATSGSCAGGDSWYVAPCQAHKVQTETTRRHTADGLHGPSQIGYQHYNKKTKITLWCHSGSLCSQRGKDGASLRCSGSLPGGNELYPGWRGNSYLRWFQYSVTLFESWWFRRRGPCTSMGWKLNKS